MSKEKDLRNIVLVTGEGKDKMRFHLAINEKAYQRAIEMMDQVE